MLTEVFSVDLLSSFFKIDVLKSQLLLCLSTVSVCDIVNHAGMCGRSAYYVTRQYISVFHCAQSRIQQQKTQQVTHTHTHPHPHIHKVGWGWRGDTSLAQILTEQPHETRKTEQLICTFSTFSDKLAIVWSTPGLGRALVSSGFSTEGTLISASAVSHSGILHCRIEPKIVNEN